MKTQHIDIYQSYTIDEHPNPEACYDWIRNNWLDLHEHTGHEVIESLKGFADTWGLSLDYSIAPFGDRGEFIQFSHGYELDPTEWRRLSAACDMDPVRLWKYLHNNQYITPDLIAGNCPLTGVCYDEELLDPIREFAAHPVGDLEDLLTDVANAALCAYHADCNYLYSDGGLHELCEANEYEFTEDGTGI